MDIQELYKYFLESTGVTTDSRNTPENSIFFALKGETFNGNKFAKQALENGCAYVVIDEKEYVLGERYILVNDVLETLQKLANYHRQNFKIPVIAITGTNGKTTTKELIAAVLAKKYKIAFTQGNLNNHIGVPLTLLSLNKSHEMAIIEMGANHPGEIKMLCEISNPNYGIITNIGKAHLEGFGSFENVIKTKKELYDYILKVKGKVFYNCQNDILSGIVKELGVEAVTFGCEECIAELLPTNQYVKANVYYDNKVNYIETNIIGNYNLENILAAFRIGKYFDVEDQEIISAINEYTPKNNRSQFINTGKNNLILDAYNANPTSVMAALNNFISLKQENKILILGDMMELGEDSITEHKNIIDFLKLHEFERIFLVGEIYSSINTSKSITSFKNVTELSEWIDKNPVKDKFILIKGSRAIKLEKLTEKL